MRSQLPVRSKGRSPARKTCSQLPSATDKGGPITNRVQVMFDANVHGEMREANSATACWAGRVGLAAQCGRDAAIRIGCYALPPSIGWPSARQRSGPPAKLATFL